MLWVDEDAYINLRAATVAAMMRSRDARGFLVHPGFEHDIENTLLGMLTAVCGTPVVREGTVFVMPVSLCSKEDGYAPVLTWPPHPVPPKGKY